MSRAGRTPAKPLNLLPATGDPAHVCQVECGAQCCRTQHTRPLTVPREMITLRARARERGHKITLTRLDPAVWGMNVRPDGTWEPMFVLERDPETGACPFLTADSRCGIYEDRPQTCRDFPRRPIVGCRLLPGVPGRDEGL